MSGFVSKVSDGAACAGTALLSLPSQMRSRRRAHLIHPSVCPGSPVLLAPHTAVVNAGARGFRGVPCLRVSRIPRGGIAGAGAFPRAPASQAAEPAAGSALHLPVFSDCRHIVAGLSLIAGPPQGFVCCDSRWCLVALGEQQICGGPDLALPDVLPHPPKRDRAQAPRGVPGPRGKGQTPTEVSRDPRSEGRKGRTPSRGYVPCGWGLSCAGSHFT